MTTTLTRGSIRQIYDGQQPPRPTVQLVDVKKITHPSSGERYRLILSDGVTFSQGMLSTQSAHLISEGRIRKYSVVTLDEYMLNNVQSKKIIIVLRCSFVQDLTTQIGNPTNVAESASSSAPGAGGYGAGYPSGGSGFGQHRAQPPPVPPPSASGGVAWGGNRSFNAPPSGMGQENFQPITTLNPYQGGWRIKARVTSKSQIKHWKNARGEGKLFSIDMLDKDGGEMRATMFNDACDKFYQVFETNKVYIVAKGVIKMARKQFTHLKNDYEMTLNADAEVVPVQDDQGIETQRYNFVKIGDVQNAPANSYVDILAIVLNVQHVTKVQTKTGKELDKRSLVLADDTATIELTLWNEQAIQYDEEKLQNRPVIAVRGARVSDFGGKSLSAGASSPEVWPDRQEARDLQAWFTRGGGLEGGVLRDVVSLTSIGAGGIGSASAPFKTFGEVRDEQIGMHTTEEKKSEYFSNIAWITAVSHSEERPPWYLACPDPDNNFKVTDNGNGQFFCERNSKIYTSYEPRYILRFQCMDHTGQQWMSSFHDVAEKLVNVPCRQAEMYLNNGQKEEFNKIFSDATFKRFSFKCRAKSDQYQDEIKVRVDAVDFVEVDPVEQSKLMLDKIRTMMANRQQQY